MSIISIDMSKQAQSQRRMVRSNNEENFYDDNNQFALPLQQYPNYTPHYHPKALNGNLIILSQRLHLSLGPDYAFFIIGSLMILTVTSILLYCAFAIMKKQQEQQSLFSYFMRAATVFMAVWVNSAYIITALSDPGVYKPGQIALSETDTLRNCLTCKLHIPSNVQHCNTCGVCISQLDHHCPWMSKCVGKNNIRSFWGFIIGVFVMMGLFWVSIFVMLTQ